MSFNAGSTIARASSGSRSSINSIEPLISANSAVTILRSPPRFSGSGASATRIGASFDVCSDPTVGISSEAPQSLQNFAVEEFSALHLAHRFESGLPHSGQNFLPDVLSAPHFGQRMLVA